jgi:hypothetical protein
MDRMSKVVQAEDFSSDGQYPFGVVNAKAAAALRKLVDGIEAGTIVPQRARIGGGAVIDDYVMHTLMFRWVERV